MKTSKNGIAIIREFEGCKLTAYRCAANVLTIGYGHTKGVKDGQIITENEAIEFLKQDLNIAETYLNKHLPNLNQNQFDALVSFIFNCGIGAFERSTLFRMIKNNSNDSLIKWEFRKWNKANGKILNGLTNRRIKESELYFNSEYHE